MTDFEDTFKRLLNENVDAVLGRRRPAPQLNLATAAAGRGFRPWLVPLLAAAGVAAAIAAIVVPAHLVADRPAGEANSGGLIAPPSNSTALQSNSAAPPTETSDPNAPPPSPLPPASTAVDLGGAKLRLPVGWVANEVTDPNQYGSSVYSREWCLSPAASAGRPRADCPLQFGPAASVTTSGVPVNSNVPLGTLPGGKQSSCSASVFWDQMGGSFVHFGQRPVIESDFIGSCPDGSTPSVEQYVVNTAPGYVLFANQLTPELTAAMYEITSYASLPAQTEPLLLYDVGTVQAVTRHSNGYLMTITPVMRMGGGWIATGEAHRNYVIRPADLSSAAVGTQVGVTTDGTKVISIGDPTSAR